MASRLESPPARPATRPSVMASVQPPADCGSRPHTAPRSAGHRETQSLLAERIGFRRLGREAKQVLLARTVPGREWPALPFLGVRLGPCQKIPPANLLERTGQLAAHHWIPIVPGCPAEAGSLVAAPRARRRLPRIRYPFRICLDRGDPASIELGADRLD